MYDFVPTIRTDRRREIALYQEKGYSFLDQNGFWYVNKIQVDYNGALIDFDVKANANEIYFYITNDSGSIYLSIYEVYKLLLEMKNSFGTDYDVIFNEFTNVNLDENSEFKYLNIDYSLRKIPEGLTDREIPLFDSNTKITEVQLYILIFLIQEKSNYFFSLSDSKIDYKDGLIRLLLVLLESNKEDCLLDELGWKYSEQEGCFIQVTSEKTARAKQKYYLTEVEQRNIIKLES